MSLITLANLKAYSDKLGAAMAIAKPVVGTKSGSIVQGTIRDLGDELLTLVVATVDDYEQQQDLGTATYNFANAANVEKVVGGILSPAVAALQGHCGTRGRAVDAAIVDINTFLTYYNTSVAFSALVSPEFNEACLGALKSYLLPANVYSPALAVSQGVTNGMGTRSVGGSFTDGSAVDTTKYTGVNLVAMVTTTFVSGATQATVTVAGTDHTGATTTTWTGTLPGNNPAANGLATTLAGAVSAPGRVTVNLTSGTGFVVGSWITVDSGLNQEVVLVEALATNALTAVFRKSHLSGVAVAGTTGVALTPSVAGRRCTNVSGITIGVGAHNAGAVTIEGVQDRVAA